MNELLLIKSIHILSATLLFGTGLGSAFYKWCADRHGDLPAMVHTNRIVVIADWLFTTPTVLLQPITGLWLLHLMGIPWTQGWVVLTLLLYGVAGFCWLPVVWLQIKMRNLASAAQASRQSVGQRYRRYARIWFWLGIPAFGAMIAIYLLMVFKPVIGIQLITPM